MEPVTLSEPFAEALDKLRSAVDILDLWGEDGSEAARNLVEQAAILLAP